MATGDEGVNTTQMTSLTVMRSSAAERNKQTILEALKKILPTDTPANVLEVASGTGQHVAFFAKHLPHVTWQPSECDPVYITSIQCYIQITQRDNIRDPMKIDTREDPDKWGASGGGTLLKSSFDFVLCINMLHFCEWTACEGLFKGAEYYLKPGGALVAYGPFKVEGVTSPESNVEFDSMIRQQNSEWGLRDTADLNNLAQLNNMTSENMIEMNSNHKLLIFRKKA